MGRIAGKYESDREDDRFESGNGIDQIRRDLDAKDRLIKVFLYKYQTKFTYLY